MSQNAQYEIGNKGNIVSYGSRNGTVFVDSRRRINDNEPPNPSVLWSSAKVAQQLEKVKNQILASLGGNVNLGGSMNANMNANMNVRPNEVNMKHQNMNYGASGFRRYTVWKFLRPSYYLSYVIPSREHYCKKCCNYKQHFWSSMWKDNPRLDNYSCPSRCTGPNTSPSN